MRNMGINSHIDCYMPSIKLVIAYISLVAHVHVSTCRYFLFAAVVVVAGFVCSFNFLHSKRSVSDSIVI